MIYLVLLLVSLYRRSWIHVHHHSKRDTQQLNIHSHTRHQRYTLTYRFPDTHCTYLKHRHITHFLLSYLIFLFQLTTLFDSGDDSLIWLSTLRVIVAIGVVCAHHRTAVFSKLRSRYSYIDSSSSCCIYAYCQTIKIYDSLRQRSRSTLLYDNGRDLRFSTILDDVATKFHGHT